MPRKDAGGGPISAQAQQDLVSEGIENFELPKSIVTKIAKSAIPDNAKLQKETVLSLVKGSTVFINYLAATAHDVALSKQHKSISASDVLKALEMVEFGDLVDPLQQELQIYRDNAKGDKNRKSAVDHSSSSSKGKAKDGESISSASRSKGKAREALPSPFTSVPRPAGPSSASHTTEDVNMGAPTGESEEVGEGGGEGKGGGEGEGEGGRDYDSEIEVDDPAEYDETEEEEVMDVVPDESEELRKKAAGLEDAGPGLGED